VKRNRPSLFYERRCASLPGCLSDGFREAQGIETRRHASALGDQRGGRVKQRQADGGVMLEGPQAVPEADGEAEGAQAGTLKGSGSLAERRNGQPGLEGQVSVGGKVA
jgi:hypothetical protein